MKPQDPRTMLSLQEPQDPKPEDMLADPLEGTSTSRSIQSPEFGLQHLRCHKHPYHQVTKEGMPAKYKQSAKEVASWLLKN